MQETWPGLDAVYMEVSEKEPVPEFQSLAKCDQHNDQVGDAREWRVIGMGRSGKCGQQQHEINPVGFIWSDEDSSGRLYQK